MDDEEKFRCEIAPPEVIKAVNQYECVFDQDIGRAIGWVYNQQGWKSASLASKILGVTEKTFQNYRTPGYRKKRSLHVIAALSWVTQVSMSAFYMGRKPQMLWPEIDKHVIEAVVYTGVLTLDQYIAFIKVVSDEGFVSDKQVVFSERILNELRSFPDGDFLAPVPLDIEAFKLDYYQSIGVSLEKLRTTNGFSLEDMARAFDIPVRRYLSFESREAVSPVPAYLGVRLKRCFTGLDTTVFTDEMKFFDGFNQSRLVQEKREKITISLLQGASEVQRNKLAKLAKSFFQYRVNTYKE